MSRVYRVTLTADFNVIADDRMAAIEYAEEHWPVTALAGRLPIGALPRWSAQEIQRQDTTMRLRCINGEPA